MLISSPPQIDTIKTLLFPPDDDKNYHIQLAVAAAAAAEACCCRILHRFSPLSALSVCALAEDLCLELLLLFKSICSERCEKEAASTMQPSSKAAAPVMPSSISELPASDSQAAAACREQAMSNTRASASATASSTLAWSPVAASSLEGCANLLLRDGFDR
jgi:hypothetical protein